MITQNRVLELFSYVDGNLIWRCSRGRVKAGHVAGCNMGDGYLGVRVDGVLYRLHRIIWLYCYGAFPNNFIDHIDRNKKNNRIENLRDVTQGENLQNCTIRINNLSGVAGVNWDKSRNKWLVRITINGKGINLGRFDDKLVARAVYEKAKAIYHPYSTQAAK